MVFSAFGSGHECFWFRHVVNGLSQDFFQFLHVGDAAYFFWKDGFTDDDAMVPFGFVEQFVRHAHLADTPIDDPEEIEEG